MSVKQEILVVDDRPENLYAVRQTLSELDVELVEAGSGEEALAKTLGRDFALAILDVQMPGMDGYELAALLRGDQTTSHIPIIFLTAAAPDEQQIFQGYSAGAVDYIIKPYHPAILLSKAGIFLELHAQRLELSRHQAQLQAANAELEAYAHSVSHDLRAPLRAIDGFSQALLEDCLSKLDPTEQDFLQRISREAQRMNGLIEDLLALSKVSRQELRFVEVDLSDLATRILARLRDAEPERQVTVQIAEDLKAEGDARLLEQALENLLGNAWKYTAKRAQAEIRFGRNAGAYFVRDNGVGFDMKYADKLFAPFQRLHGQDEFAGSGVGLSTVKRVLDRHGGRIWCESEVDRGATFYFTVRPITD